MNKKVGVKRYLFFVWSRDIVQNMKLMAVMIWNRINCPFA